MRRITTSTTMLCLAPLLALGLAAGCEWEQRDLGRVSCGDGVCAAGESPVTCAADCASGQCGNHLCELTEDPDTCPEDCTEATCGDGTCGDGENLYTCPEDCPWNTCGNGVCEAGEEDGGCAKDCFVQTCGNGLCEGHETTVTCPIDCPATRQVDLLFVVDDSGSMAEEQYLLSRTLPILYENLQLVAGDLPDVHVGVVSTDVGTGPYPITYCQDPTPGWLLAPPEAGLAGKPYMIDAPPTAGSCELVRDADGSCTSYTCDASACATEDGSDVGLVADPATGCPRCRNFAGDPDDVFRVLASPGTFGCGFEQPLEAMYRALDGSVPQNAGFLRPGAVLAVMFITDEDDCSASSNELFDTSQTDMYSTLGPLTSYRCFEFGIVCNANNRHIPGERIDCRPREDPGSLLHPLERYRDLLLGLKPPGQLVVRALAGQVQPTERGFAATVGSSDFNQPELQFSCVTDLGGATPGIRLASFLQYFNGPSEMVRAYQSICSSSYDTTVEDLGVTVKRRLTY